MSKILVLGDIHGRTCWKDIVSPEYDKIIFLGDYLSSHEDISEDLQLENLRNILHFKEDNLEQVILLRGNHCMDSLGYSWARCYPMFIHKELVPKEKFLKLTQWMYKEGDLLFSHAGITNTWLKSTGVSLEELNELPPSELFSFTPNSIWDSSGTSVTQPLTWIRPQSLVDDMLEGYTQIVGHTPVYEIRKIDNLCLCLCDCLPKQYLVIDNGEFIVKDV